MSILTDQNRPITNYTTLWKMVENSAISTFCLLVQKKFLQYTYTLVTSLLIIWVIPLHTQLMGLYDRTPLSQQEQGALRGDLFVAQFLSSCHMVKIVTLQSRDRFQHGWMLTMEFKAHVKGLLKEVKDRIDWFSSALANKSPSFSLKKSSFESHKLATLSMYEQPSNLSKLRTQQNPGFLFSSSTRVASSRVNNVQFLYVRT